MRQVVSWALLFPSGEVKKGQGDRPPSGWHTEVRFATGLALLHPGLPPVYVVHPVSCNDVDIAVTTAGVVETRWWGAEPGPGQRLWLWHDGSMIGVGHDTSEVQRLVLAFQGKLPPGKVAHGPDQRDRAEQVPSG